MTSEHQLKAKAATIQMQSPFEAQHVYKFTGHHGTHFDQRGSHESEKDSCVWI